MLTYYISLFILKQFGLGIFMQFEPDILASLRTSEWPESTAY